MLRFLQCTQTLCMDLSYLVLAVIYCMSGAPGSRQITCSVYLSVALMPGLQHNFSSSDQRLQTPQWRRNGRVRVTSPCCITFINSQHTFLQQHKLSEKAKQTWDCWAETNWHQRFRLTLDSDRGGCLTQQALFEIVRHFWKVIDVMWCDVMKLRCFPFSSGGLASDLK